MNLLGNQQLAEAVDSSYIDLETMLMQNIARHIQDYGQAIDSDKWLLQKLAEIGQLNKENMKTIAQMAGVSQSAAERMLQEVMDDAISATEPGFRHLVRQSLVDDAVDAGKSKTVKQVMKSLRDQAKDTLNICNTTMLYKARDAFTGLVQSIVRDAEEIAEKQSFLDILGKHATAATIGAESRQQAVRKCIREFNEKGIPAFVDKAGREWTPEAYVNMAMRNTARQTAEEVQTARCKDFGVNLISIDSHSGARPKCAKDQGKIFDLNNKSGYTEDLKGKRIRYYPWKDSSYGEPDGILGINCGHHKWPFIPGVNIHRYFPTDDLDANNKLYKETQVQRALERDVRKQKRECMLFDELGAKDAFKEASVKLKQKEAKLKYYVDSKDHLHRRRDREQVVGFDKRVSAEAVGKAQKHYKDWAKSIGAESGPKNLAGYYDLKYNKDTKESRLYRGYVDAVNKGRISPLVGYDQFKKVDSDISKKLDGATTVTGVKIKGHTAHFVDRIIGTHAGVNMPASKDLTKRLDHLSVSVDEALQALTEGEPGEIITGKNGQRSQRFTGDKCIVTFNPDTRELIQTNRKR